MFWTWKYKSYETGVLEKAHSPARWIFKTLTHDRVELASGSTPPYTQVSNSNGTGTPNIDTDQSNAYMKVEFSVTIREIKWNTTTTRPLTSYSPCWYAQ